MSTLPHAASHPPRAARTFPPLQNGDRLTRAEFGRRYVAMPDVRKAELIEGEVYLSSRVQHNEHARPHSSISGWAGFYAAHTRGVEGAVDGTVRLDRANEVQPDVSLRNQSALGGQTKVSDGYIDGAPELVIEVSASTVSIDLNKKLKAYERNGVREYLVWRVEDEAIDWFTLEDDAYRPLAADASGVLHSIVLPGLRLDAAALLKGDLARVLAALQEGLASPEHAAFVASLATPPATPP